MLYVVVFNLLSGFVPIRHILTVCNDSTDDILSFYYCHYKCLIGDSFVVFSSMKDAQSFADFITRSFYEKR